MAAFLPSRAKVVTRSGIFLLLLSIVHSASSQVTSHSSNKITLECYRCAFGDVLTRVEEQSGLHFIYSTNKIQADRLVTLREIEKSVDEILALLGQLTGLHFRKSGEYVVVKNGKARSASAVAAPPPAGKAMAQAILRPEEKFSGMQTASAALPETSASASPTTLVKPHPDLGELSLKKPPHVFSQYFDAKKLSALPRPYIRSLNLRNSHPGWFISAGLSLNRYSAGAEVQAGLRSVFLVYRPSWFKDGSFQGSYGLGMSMPMTHNVSWNMIYTYGVVNNSINRDGSAADSKSLRATISSSHHVARFMLQYAITRNVRLQGGFSVNFLDRKFEIAVQDQTAVQSSAVAQGYAADKISVGRSNTRSSVGGVDMIYHRILIRKAEPARVTPQGRMWLGWETSLSYRFNFFRKQ